MKKTLAVSLVALSTLLAGGNALADAKADRIGPSHQHTVRE
jgi:hypothetical protein